MTESFERVSFFAFHFWFWRGWGWGWGRGLAGLGWGWAGLGGLGTGCWAGLGWPGNWLAGLGWAGPRWAGLTAGCWAGLTESFDRAGCGLQSRTCAVAAYNFYLSCLESLGFRGLGFSGFLGHSYRADEAS